uniref:hypothetical protein n=1 Tax=Gemmiger formicilis TaxID=745368 RepID=UPI004025AEFB
VSYYYLFYRLSKNACRGEHCSPVPVCLAKNCPGKCVAAPSWRATNGRPYILYIAKSMFLLYLLCSKAQDSLQQSAQRFFSDFIFYFNFAVPTPYSHGVRRQQTDRMFPCKEKIYLLQKENVL